MDLLIEDALVLTMTGNGVGAVPGGFVAVSGNRIAAVGPMCELPASYRDRPSRVISAGGKVVLPGLIDGHIHTALSLFRGLAQDMDNWMHYGLAPYASYLTAPAAEKGTALAAVEAVKSGTTTLLDFGYPMKPACELYEKLGVRARVASRITEVSRSKGEIPPGEVYPFDEKQGQRLFDENVSLIEEWNNGAEGRITCMFGPQGPDMVSEKLLLQVKEAARDLGVAIHMHVAQGDREIDQMLKRYGSRSIPFLHEIGYLDSSLLAVHLTEALPDEVSLLAESGASMVCCPSSIAIIDGIVPPVMEFLDCGGSSALGSDQAPGNNCHSIWNEMKLVALLNKVKFKDPKVMPAWKALRMATVEGALAVGLGDQVGTLEPGKFADLIIVDLAGPGMAPYLEYPVRNVVPNLVYAARGHEVETVVIDGKIIVDNRRLVTADESRIIEDAREAAVLCAAKAAETVLRLNKGPAEMMQKGLI